ncbi:monoterpene epsilon-lactone hydrolase [Microbacterium sp. W4I4]|uniref:alpha/beta hydrolase n=1 Tax=Microbacterium sp. W4I4 TaxID=3042295 RepID=UPI00277DE219|nr:alpha/beta hydrolase [Microbacterium sp. W4I4]MDQ0613991.1 monoterpene epsilon-lactone hydrolase [Microbacterium sp. W4I4]
MIDFTSEPKRVGLVGTALTGFLAMNARRREGQPFDLQAARRHNLRITGRFRLPRDVKRTEEHIDGIPVIRFSSGRGDRGTVLAFHGGAYVLGDPGALSIPFATKGGPDVVSVDYRLAPEHPYPAALDDALTVYRALLKTVGADRMAITGDSAGGGLALTVLQAVVAAGLPMVTALVAVFPWGDLSLSGRSSTANNGRDILVRSEVALSARWYASDRDLQDPAVSPLFGSFRGFPKTYMPVGSRDLILDDARRIEARMRADGIDVQLDIFPGAPHGFNAVPFAASRQCNARARAIINDALPPRH